MKSRTEIVSLAISLTLATALFAAPVECDFPSLVDCVDPMIGAVTYAEIGMRGDEAYHGFGKTFPGAGVTAELTASARSGLVRFTYEKGGTGEFSIDLARGTARRRSARCG